MWKKQIPYFIQLLFSKYNCYNCPSIEGPCDGCDNLFTSTNDVKQHIVRYHKKDLKMHVNWSRLYNKTAKLRKSGQAAREGRGGLGSWLLNQGGGGDYLMNEVSEGPSDHHNPVEQHKEVGVTLQQDSWLLNEGWDYSHVGLRCGEYTCVFSQGHLHKTITH